MADKNALREQLEEYRNVMPTRKNGDRRIYNDEQRALLDLLTGIIDSLPDDEPTIASGGVEGSFNRSDGTEIPPGGWQA